MKKAILCGLALMLVLSVATRAEDLDEVLANYYEAIGGLEAWQSLESIRVTGTMSMGQGMEMPITVTQKRPGKLRQEFTMQGMTGIMAGDGENWWMYMPFMGKAEAEVMPEDQVKTMSRQADIEGPLIGWKEKGHAVEFIGKEDLEGTEVYHLQLTRESGDVEHHFLDAEYFIPLQVDLKTEQQGQEIEMKMIFGDYKEVEGLMIAHSMQIVGGMGGNLVMSSVEINIDIDDSEFVMPEPAEAATGTDG